MKKKIRNLIKDFKDSNKINMESALKKLRNIYASLSKNRINETSLMMLHKSLEKVTMEYIHPNQFPYFLLNRKIKVTNYTHIMTGDFNFKQDERA